MDEKIKRPLLKSGFMPLRITRPALASHIPYSLNRMTRRLSEMIEREVVPDSPPSELEYGPNPSQPAFAATKEQKTN